MGKADRLKKSGTVKPYREWFVGIKRDLSYTLKKTVDGKETTESVERRLIIPLTTKTGQALFGKTVADATREINDLIDSMPEEIKYDKNNDLFKLEVYVFELRNGLGRPRSFYDSEWCRTHVLSEERIRLESRKPGRLL